MRVAYRSTCTAAAALACLVASLAGVDVASGQPASTDLVENGGFEDGDNGWDSVGDGYSISDTIAYSGSQSLMIASIVGVCPFSLSNIPLSFFLLALFFASLQRFPFCVW